MGIDHLFKGAGDLSGFSKTSIFSFNGISHATELVVNEDGSAFGAATGTNSRSFTIPPKVICNHPFVFAIHDDELQEILLTAVYRDPQ